jgi:hypothetical protein
MEKHFGAYNKLAVDQWKEFKSKCPQDDNAQRFVEENPESFKIPLYDVLFGSVPVDKSLYIAPVKPKVVFIVDFHS